MVQMKVKKEVKKMRLIGKLYIPHGSDEREPYEPSEWFHHILYIPHGSDESTNSSHQI